MLDIDISRAMQATDIQIKVIEGNSIFLTNKNELIPINLLVK